MDYKNYIVIQRIQNNSELYWHLDIASDLLEATMIVARAMEDMYSLTDLIEIRPILNDELYFNSDGSYEVFDTYMNPYF